MSDSLRDIMRKVGRDDVREREQVKWQERAEELLGHREQEAAKDEVEKRHDKYRRQQEYASRLGPAAERLPILTKEESARRERERPKGRTYEFEGPIEKLLENITSVICIDCVQRESNWKEHNFLAFNLDNRNFLDFSNVLS